MVAPLVGTSAPAAAARGATADSAGDAADAADATAAAAAAAWAVWAVWMAPRVLVGGRGITWGAGFGASVCEAMPLPSSFGRSVP